MGRKPRQWNEYEDQYLRDFFRKKLTSEVAEALGISYSSVRHRAIQLGLLQHGPAFLACSKKDSELTEEQRILKRMAAEKRKRTLIARKKRDLIRIAAGLDPIWNYPGTRFRTVEGEKRRLAKYRLKNKYGYVTGEGLTVYYSETTRRTKCEHLYERRHRLKFRPIDFIRASGTTTPPQWRDRQGGFNSFIN